MARKSLTDRAARNAKAKEKSYKLSAGSGLYLLVMPNGSRYWRMKYSFAGKEKLLSIGVYPEITLKEAVEQRDAARAQLRAGQDPSEEKQLQKLKAELSVDGRFEAIALEWLESRRDLAASTWAKAKWMLETYAFPWLGRRPIDSISTSEVLAVLRRLETQDKIESTQRLRQICGQVFRYAVATGRLDRDPTTALRGSLKTAKNRHDASITDPVKVGELLRAIDDGLLCSMSAVGHCGERVACPRGTMPPARAFSDCSNASGSIAQRIPHSMPPGPMCSNTSSAATTPGCDGVGSSRTRSFQPFPNSP